MRVLAGVALAAAGVQASTLPTALTSEKAIRDATVAKCYEKLAAMFTLNAPAAVDSDALKAAFKKFGLGQRTDGAEGDHKYPGSCATSGASGTAVADDSDLDAKVTTSVLGDSTKHGSCCLVSPSYSTSSYGDSTAATKDDMLAIFGGVATSGTDSEKGGKMALGLNTAGASGVPTPNVPAKATLATDAYASYQNTAVGGCAAVQQAGLPSIDSFATANLAATITNQGTNSVSYGLVEGFKLRDHKANNQASETTLFIRQGSTASTTNGLSSKACTLAKVKTIKSAMHGACEAAFAQNWGAATPAKAALATSFAFSNMHVGDLAGQFYTAVVGSGYPNTITTNTCATTATDSGSSIADATANAVAQNSECEQAVLDVFRHNGGFSSGSTALTADTVYQGSTTALSDVGSGNEWYGRYDKAVYDGTLDKAAEYTANFHNYLMPKKFANAGSTFFEIKNPTISFDSSMTADLCKAWIDTVDSKSTIAAQTVTDTGGGDTAKKVVTLVDDNTSDFTTNANTKVKDRIKIGMKIIGLKNAANDAKFHAISAATGIGSEASAASMAGILKAECVLKGDGGLVVTYDTAVRDEDKVPQFALASGKTASADGSVASADCPADMRTALKKVMSEHCFVGAHLVNPKDAKGYYAAFQFNLGQLTKIPPLTSSDVAGAVAVTDANLALLKQKSGILPQALAACGYNAPVCPKGSGGAAASDCTSCAKGKYSDVNTITACKSCDKGKYRGSTGATHADECLTCPKGKYGNQLAQSSCTTCAKGKYSAAAGATVCTACSSGKNTTAAGATALANCTSGSGGSGSGGSDSGSSTAASGAVARFSALAITSLLALIAM